MKRLFLVAVIAFSSFAFAQHSETIMARRRITVALPCTNTAYGSYTCKSLSTGFTNATSKSTTISVTSGDAVLLIGQALGSGSTLTLTDSGACTGSINTAGSPNGLAFGTTSVVIVGLTTATSTGTCTIVMHWGGTAVSITSLISNWSGFNGTTDQTGNLASVTGQTNVSCPAVTTTVSGDLVLCLAIEPGNNSDIYTPVSPFVLTGSGQSAEQQADVQGAAGAITPKFNYTISSTFGVATFALE